MMCRKCFHFMPKGVCEACNPEPLPLAAATEYDNSFQWWGTFVAARANAIQSMSRLGKSDDEIVKQLNLQDLGHMQRIRSATQGKF